MSDKKAFTLIELVMIIVILGIVAAVALPAFYDLQDDAKIAAQLAIAGAVRTGISTYYANQCLSGACAWPDALHTDTSNHWCTPSLPCFDKVLTPPITDSTWFINAGAGPEHAWYRPQSAGTPQWRYQYDNTTGKFWCMYGYDCSCP